VKTVNTKNGGSCPRADQHGGPSAGSVTGPRTDATLSLQAPSVSTGNQASPATIIEGSPSDVGDLTIFDSQPGLYDVFGYDYTKAYRAGSVASEAVQQMVYLRGAAQQEFFVEFNHLRATAETRKLLHAPADVAAIGGSWTPSGSGQWTTTARLFSITNTYGGSHGRLFITSALPAAASFVKIGGPGKEWVDADGNAIYGGSLDDECRNLAGYYTLQIRTSEPDLITVYQPGDSLTMAAAAPVSAVSAAGMRGVQVEGHVVLFSLEPRQSPVSATSYTVTATQSSRHVLVGLTPSATYAIGINGVTQSFGSSRGGVLSFSDAGTGTRAITISAGPPGVRGDVDGSGTVTLADLRKLIRMLTGQEPPNDAAKTLAAPADRLTLADARALMQLLVSQ
jgi:hypothetical protein